MRIQIKLRNDFVTRINTMSDYMTASIYFHPTIRADESTVKSGKPPIIGVSPDFVTKSFNLPDHPCIDDFDKMVHVINKYVSSKDIDATGVDMNCNGMIPWDQVRSEFYVLDENSHIMIRHRNSNNDTWAYVSIPLVTEDGFVSMDEWILPRIVFEIVPGARQHRAIDSLYQSVQLLSSYRMIQAYTKDPETGHPCIIRTYVDGNGSIMAVIYITPKFVRMKCRTFLGMWVTHPYHIIGPESIKDLVECDSFIIKPAHSRNERPHKAFKIDTFWSNIIRRDWWAYENTNRS